MSRSKLVPLGGLNLEEWLAHFKVKFVPPDELPDDLISIHKLTTFGRGHHLDENEIWISSDYREFADIILLHEGIENYLRRQGYSYGISHDLAMVSECRAFGGTDHYDDFIAKTLEE